MISKWAKKGTVISQKETNNSNVIPTLIVHLDTAIDFSGT
jgi:hypothetical protein